MTKQFLYLLFLGFFVLACHGKVIEEPVAPPTPKPEQEKPPCLTCNYDEDNPSGCVTCADEQVSEIYTDVKAKVLGNIYITNLSTAPAFTIVKKNLEDGGGSFTSYPDSTLILCKKIPAAYDTIGKIVKISGKLMSCKNLVICRQCNGSYGRKFILTQIR